MKDKFDDLFRENIDNRSFDYQDEFWGDIAAELDARDKKKKRPFFWVFAGLAMPIFIAIGAYYFAPFGENDLPQADATQLIFEDKKEAETKIENVNPTFTNPLRISKRYEKTLAETNPKTEIQISKTKTLPSKNIDKKEVTVPKINLKNSTSSFAKNDKTLGQIEIQKTSEITDNQLVKNNKFIEPSIKNVDEINLDEIEILHKKTLERANFYIEKGQESFVEAVPLISKEEKRKTLSKIDFLEKLPFSKIKKPENPSPNFTKQIIPISKKFNSFWTFGIIATGGIDNQENQFSNWSAGIFADYRFAKKWSVDGAISYGEFTGDFGDTNSSLQTNYSFGRNREMQKLKAEKLSLLSLPVMLNFHQKRHQFGIGIQTDYVLAVHGEKELFKEEKMFFARVSSQSGVMTKTTEIPGLNFGGTASYQHNFTHFSLGARGRYYFKNYLPAPDPIVLPKDLMMFDLILKVKF